jgi:uncharacterized protein YjbJ (UPF0337 family)
MAPEAPGPPATSRVTRPRARPPTAGEGQQTRATESLKALRDEARAEPRQTKADALGRSTPTSGGSGVVAETKGEVKQAAGRVVGDSDLTDEGRIDEERGATERRATKDRVSARAHEAKAKSAENPEDAANR